MSHWGIYLLIGLVLFLIAGSLLERYNRKVEAEHPGPDITRHTTIGTLLSYDPGVAAVLTAQGMHCVGCPSSQAESIEQAALVHGINADELLASVRKYFEEHPVKPKE
ncbi:MAG: DUF1858 domain-containing protein [Lachnospiraceae bacterium]|nr:DUF1858 domain-containing protein [Lachnospiraceae bacterium]